MRYATTSGSSTYIYQSENKQATTSGSIPFFHRLKILSVVTVHSISLCNKVISVNPYLYTLSGTELRVQDTYI